MLAGIKEKITRITKAAGVEITLLPDNQYRILVTILALQKKNVVVEKKEKLTSLESLKDTIGKDVPLYLVLNGRGILHKKLSEVAVENNELIQSVLPNAKAQDFYVQNIVSEKNSLVSIVRKESADPILDTLTRLSLPCTGFSLGAAVVAPVLPLLAGNSNLSSFTWSEHHLEMDLSSTVTDYKFYGTPVERKIFQLDTEKLEDEFLVSYASAFSILIGQEPVPAFVEKVQLSKEEFSNGQLFKKMSWVVLGFFLVLLMLNFLFFTNLSSRNNELVQRESKYSTMFAEMENLSKEVKEKETFLSGAGWLQSSAASYYADRIAATVPASVKLTELAINPLDEKKSKEEKKELFATGSILIKGDCTRPTELNEWLDKIKSIDKINKARLVNYFYDNKENRGTFSIEIETEN